MAANERPSIDIGADFKKTIQEFCERNGVTMTSANGVFTPEGDIELTVKVVYSPNGFLKKFFNLI